jgi:hypothetical protein
MGSGMAQMFMPRLFGDLKNILPGASPKWPSDQAPA